MLALGGWAALGLAIGTIGTILGAGGGFVLVPLLMLLDPALEPRVVTAVSLAVVAANATSGSIAYALRRRIAWSFAAWFSLWSLPGAAAGVWLVARVDRRAFAPAFAGLLIILALYAALRAQQSTADARVPLLDGGTALKGALVSAGVGVVAVFLGIGGGIVHVPLMVYWLGFPAHAAAATSHFVLALTALAASMMHWASGDLAGQWPRIGPLGLGVILGAQLGARLSPHVRGPWIMRAMALGLLLVALRLLWSM